MPTRTTEPVSILSPLREALTRLIVPEDPESIWRSEHALQCAHKSGHFSAVLNFELAALVNDAAREAWRTVPLLREKWFTVNLRGFDIAKDTPVSELVPAAQHKLYMNIGQSPITFDAYRRTGGEIEVFDQRSRLIPRGEVMLHSGHFLRARAGLDVFATTTGATHDPLAILSLSGPTIHQTVTVYDRETLLPLRMHGSRHSIARAQCALLMLREMKVRPTEKVVEAISTLLSDPSHVVRWSAARTLAGMSQELRVKVLSVLANDPHPHIRTAVARAVGEDSNGN